MEGAFAGSSARYAALAAHDQRKSSAVVVALGLMLLQEGLQAFYPQFDS